MPGKTRTCDPQLRKLGRGPGKSRGYGLDAAHGGTERHRTAPEASLEGFGVAKRRLRTAKTRSARPGSDRRPLIAYGDSAEAADKSLDTFDGGAWVQSAYSKPLRAIIFGFLTPNGVSLLLVLVGLCQLLSCRVHLTSLSSSIPLSRSVASETAATHQRPQPGSPTPATTSKSVMPLTMSISQSDPPSALLFEKSDILGLKVLNCLLLMAVQPLG